MSNSRPQDNVRSRRAQLAITPAPVGPRATLTEMSVTLPEGIILNVSYVADRSLLTREGFARYAATCSEISSTSLEVLAAAVVDDIANEVVPKWLRVTASIAGNVSHRATVEDHQPGWDPALYFKAGLP